MFYDIFKQLCEEKKISPSKASTEIGFSKGSVAYWKKKYIAGEDAKPDSYTAAKIANYFNVSVDYLLGRTDIPVNSSVLPVPSFVDKFQALDSLDKAKAEAYLDGLLAADKYHTP